MLGLLQYAIACDAAYTDIMPTDPILNEKYDQVDYFHNKRAAAHVAYNNAKNDFLVVHRGTDQLRDLWIAFRCSRRKFNPRFLKKELELFGQIHNAFPSIRSMRSRVAFTGHSWGGVLAMLHATKMLPDICVTFGCPRLGQPIPNCKLIRVVNGHDAVTWLTPRHQHSGTLVRLPGSRWSCFWSHGTEKYVEKLNENS